MATKTIEGLTAWCNIFQPNTKFEKPHGVYDTGIILPPEEGAELCEYLEKLAKQKLEQVIKETPENKREALRKSLSIAEMSKDDEDKDGNPTGNLLFKTKLKPVVEKRDGTSYTQKPMVLDAGLTPMRKQIDIPRGSHVKVVTEPFPYFMPSSKTVGVSLRLKKIQIIALGDGGEDDGLEATEGFVASAIAKDDKAEEETTTFEDNVVNADEDEGDF